MGNLVIKKKLMSGISSKNMFSVLAQEESDEEDNNQTKMNKQQRKASEKNLRESVGVTSGKENNKRSYEGKQVKDSYNSGEKRQYDRHSGTGKGAFNKYEKKGGVGGKGNWGTKDVEYEKKEEEIKEPVVTMDDYLKETGGQMKTTFVEEELTKKTKVEVKDKNLLVYTKKEADYHEFHNKQ